MLPPGSVGARTGVPTQGDKMQGLLSKAAVTASVVALWGAASPACAQAPVGGRDFASGDAVRAQVKAMLAGMKPDQGFTWRPLVQDGPRIAAIEIWKKPGRPAVHPMEVEYVVVLEGAGTLVLGGTLIAPVARGGNLIEGEKIEGGTTRQLGPGDVFLIPAGVPHWFGITGDHLVLLGTKLPVRQ